MKRIYTVIAIFLAATFLFAGIDKLLHYRGFANALSNYVLVPNDAVQFLTLPVIIAEIWIGIGLLIRKWRGAAALLAAIALVTFTIAVAVNYVYSPGTICGCTFTVTLGKATKAHIGTNLLLIVLAVSLALKCNRSTKQRLESPLTEAR